MKKLLLVGNPNGMNLESSYDRAFAGIGCSVEWLSIRSRVESYVRFGKLGNVLNSFVPVEQWARKANRELAVAAGQGDFEVVIVFGSAPIQAGAIAQIKAQRTDQALCFVWPDTLLNITATVLDALPVFDIVFTYSAASIEPLKRLGCNDVVWLPLAGDPAMHHPAHVNEHERSVYQADIAFIGGWRPEREAALARLSSRKLKVWGPDWGRRCKDRALLSCWQGRALRGAEFAKAVAASRINLNIIDETNAPAANMRFFEIPIAGGLQLCSPCAEMEAYFHQEEHVVYYADLDDLRARVDSLLNAPGECERIAGRGAQLATAAHTYEHRAREICDHLSKNHLWRNGI